MPRKGTSKRSARNCLICEEVTSIAHLGLDVCRACAVFYRRSQASTLKCRTNTNKCSMGKGLNCKLCRYETIDRLLKNAQPKSAIEQSPSADEPSTSSESMQSPPASVPMTHAQPRKELSLLERLRIHYKAFCYARLTGELHARSDPPHPLEISLENGPFYRGNFNTMMLGCRLFLSNALVFAEEAFPDIAMLKTSEKWAVVVNFFHRFRMFEGCYRSLKFRGGAPEFFISYSTFISTPLDHSLFEGVPETADVPGAIEYMKANGFEKNMRETQSTVARVNPCHEELLAIITIMFWSIEGPTATEQITRMAERYRKEILSELHVYYKDEMQLDNYAARLGEIMMFLQYFERSQDLRLNFEVLRLFNVMTDDNFFYQLPKA